MHAIDVFGLGVLIERRFKMHEGFKIELLPPDDDPAVLVASRPLPKKDHFDLEMPSMFGWLEPDIIKKGKPEFDGVLIPLEEFEFGDTKVLACYSEEKGTLYIKY